MANNTLTTEKKFGYAGCRDCSWTCDSKKALHYAKNHSKGRNHDVFVNLTRSIEVFPNLKRKKK